MLIHLLPMDERGFSFIEGIVTLVVLAILVLGSLGIFSHGRRRLESFGNEQLVLLLIEKKLEELKKEGLQGTSLKAGTHFEPQNPIVINGWSKVTKTKALTGELSWQVVAVDDDLDCQGQKDEDKNPVDYRQVSVSLHWKNSAGKKKQLTITTFVTP